jgi:hypothetical protein
MTKGKASSPVGLCLPDTPPTFFPLPLAVAAATRSPPLRGISASTYTIVDRDLLLPQTMLSLSLVEVTSLPLSSLPMSRPTPPHTRRPNVTNHIIQSHLRSPDPRPIVHIDLVSPSLASPFTSPHKSPLASPIFRVPRTRPVFYAHVPCASHTLGLSPPPLSCHALYPFHGYTGQIQSWPPDRIRSDAHVNALRPPLRPLPPSHRWLFLDQSGNSLFQSIPNVSIRPTC